MATLQTTCITGYLDLEQATSSTTANRVWYDSEIDKLKYRYTGAVWKVAAPAPVPNNWAGMGAAGTPSAFVAFGGINFPNTGCHVNCTTEYNGSSWTFTGAMITCLRQVKGSGTQNAALAAAGTDYVTGVESNKTNEYNGNSWANGGNMPVCTSEGAAAGTQNASLYAGGNPTGVWACTFEYNGNTWATTGALIVARGRLGGAGTQNAGLVAGGGSGTCHACTEEYNGNTWATGGAMNSGRDFLNGAGTQNAAWMAGGAARVCSECYNGTTWSNMSSLQFSRHTDGDAGGSSNNGLLVGTGSSFGNRENTVSELVSGGTSISI
jgi:hypothetical protein